MPTPDVLVSIGGSGAPAQDPTDTGQVFAVLQTQRGSIAKPQLLQSFGDYTVPFGYRQASSVASDWVETYFGEGGKKCWGMRVASSTAAQATLNLMDAAAAISLVVKAGYLGDPDPGTWANGATGGLSVQVVNTSGSFQLITFLNGVQVEASPVFSTQADCIGWAAQSSHYLQISLGASTLVPATAAAASLASGTDGTTLVDADWQNALNAIDPIYGWGQVAAPGRTSTTGQQQVLLHGLANSRFALLDGTDTSSDATIEAQAAALYGTVDSNGNLARRWGQLYAPWDRIPGLTPYTYRTVPPSARAAAAYAQVDQLGNPNQANAGRHGVAQFVQDLSQPNWTATQRAALNNAGVTISRRRFGGVIAIYGMRTLADPVGDQNWSMAPNVRAVMWFAANAFIVGEAHNFDTIDPFGHELAAYQGDLIGLGAVLNKAGALWCPSKNLSDAITVDVGPSANPTQQLAQGIVRANVKLRLSPTPEQVQVAIIKYPMTQAI